MSDSNNSENEDDEESEQEDDEESENEDDEEIEQQLSWRMSPEETFSDWTLIITTTEDPSVSNEYQPFAQKYAGCWSL